jgi:uncharacterized membrane protein YgcG
MKQMMPKLIRSPRWWPVALGALAIILISFSGSSFAAKGGDKGKPEGDEAGNNLSTPSVQTEMSTSVGARWAMPTEPELGVHYSYGCDKVESDDTFSYPNTSCVDNISNPSSYYNAEQCTDDVQPSPCQGLEVSRIYWQKVEVNDWWADDDGISPESAEVAYVDWGDALEAVSWNERSVIRVETQPYSSTIYGYLPWVNTCVDGAGGNEAAEDLCRVGLQMWHVSGQGINEHWGVRASDEEVGELPVGTSYNYDSPFQIIKTTSAHLNLTKMAPGGATCSQPGEGGQGDNPPDVGDWDSINAEWAGTCTYSDEPYSVETSVGGKYVYGFNWRMKNVELDSICPGWVKTGFWRLTFHTDPSDNVMFSDPSAPNVAPPAVPSEVRALPRNGVFNTILAEPPAVPVIDAESEDPTADDRLYRPVIDIANNLTYLDICIVGKTQGGGGGGGGKPGGGGGNPGGGGGKPGGGKP